MLETNTRTHKQTRTQTITQTHTHMYNINMRKAKAMSQLFNCSPTCGTKLIVPIMADVYTNQQYYIPLHSPLSFRSRRTVF